MTNIDALIVAKMRQCSCLFSIEKRIPCTLTILQTGFTIFIENGTGIGAPVRILDEEQQKYYSATLTQFDENGIGFEIVDLEGKNAYSIITD